MNHWHNKPYCKCKTVQGVLNHTVDEQQLKLSMKYSFLSEIYHLGCFIVIRRHIKVNEKSPDSEHAEAMALKMQQLVSLY